MYTIGIEGRGVDDRVYHVLGNVLSLPACTFGRYPVLRYNGGTSAG